MLCDVCKCNDATVFLTQITEGKMQKVNLCDACSKEKGVQDHVGKLPQRAYREVELDDRMRALNEDLQKAVAEENYENAAALRDQIKQLEHEKAV